MRTTDGELEALYREGVARRGACPSEDELARAAAGSLPHAARTRVADHIATCERCAQTYRVAHSLRSLAPGAAPSAARTATASRWIYAWAAAAAGVAAAIAVPLWLRAPPSDEPAAAPAEVRGAAQGAIEALVADGAVLSRDRFVLRWSAQPGARYRVTVATPDLEPVHEAGGLTANEHSVPPQALAPFRAGTALVWSVEAFLPDGRRVHSLARRVLVE